MLGTSHNDKGELEALETWLSWADLACLLGAGA